MIVLIGGEKGGTGKTTLATNFAALQHQQSEDLLIVDTDKQGSASAWAALRETNNGKKRISSIQKFGNTLAAEILDLSKRYKDVVIDAGGRDSIELRAAMTVAHKLVIPIQASQFDVWTIGNMNDLVEQAKAFNPNLQTFIVINRSSPNPSVSEAAEAKVLLQDFENFKLCGNMIFDRIAYRKAAKSGLSVSELQPREAKAANEIENLYEEIFA